MLLYTVVPLERIYIDHRAKEYEAKQMKDEQIEFKEALLQHGRVITRQDGEDYVIDKIYSTDMSDYLNEDYSPGKPYKFM